MNAKLIRCKPKIAVVTNITGREFSIVRDVTGRGHVLRTAARRGAKAKLVRGEWRLCTTQA